MEGYQAFKQARIEHGFSIESFSVATGIKPRSLTYYESGERSLGGVMVYKCLALFAPLELRPEEFFCEYLNYRTECDEQMLLWKAAHPRVLNYSILRHLSYDRIVHMKYRDTITAHQYEKLIYHYRATFDYLSDKLAGRDSLTNEEYESEYLEFLYNVKKVLYMKPAMEHHPLVQIVEHYFKSEFTAHTFSFLANDFAGLIGYSGLHKLRKILDGELGLDNLSMIAALKLCYVLKLNFSEIFCVGENTCI
jgi:transcriptional regulator with XRE-family HTH domain